MNERLIQQLAMSRQAHYEAAAAFDAFARSYLIDKDRADDVRDLRAMARHQVDQAKAIEQLLQEVDES